MYLNSAAVIAEKWPRESIPTVTANKVRNFFTLTT
jgi:hypothetical protein